MLEATRPTPKERAVPGQNLAIAAECLYLANLLVLPGLSFLALAYLWKKAGANAPELARSHLGQTFFVSLYGGLLLIAFSAIFLLAGGVSWEWTWVLVIIYFTCVHSTLVMLGILGLAKAIAGQAYVYPLIGRFCR